jgi:ATP-dependent Clp protease ATP-binding subunit ClpB
VLLYKSVRFFNEWESCAMSQSPQFTESVVAALESAYRTAEEQKKTEITEGHLIASLLEDPDGYFSAIIHSLHLDRDSLQKEANKVAKASPSYTSSATSPTLSSSVQKTIREAEGVAKAWHDSFISADHLFYVFWKAGNEPFASWKKNTNLSLSDIENQIKKIRGGTSMDSASAEIQPMQSP